MKSMLLTKGLIPFCVVSMALFTQCDDDTNGDSGSVQVEITDAPIDDENIQGVFVTVVDVKIDGESMPGFQEQTIDIMAYQQGAVKVLGNGAFDAGTYNNVTLVIDYEQDASGNSPGTYVRTTDGVKHALKASASAATEWTTSSNFDVDNNNRTDVVVDFDIRKAIAHTNSGSGSQYSFVSDTELTAALRVVEKEETGTIAGKFTDLLNTSEKFVVYAYEKGTYNATTEKQGSIQFKNAVSSAVVGDDGNYKLAFLEDGDYELHFIGYEDANNDGKFELEGSLLLTVVGALNLTNINVDAKATVTVDVTVTGIVPL